MSTLWRYDRFDANPHQNLLEQRADCANSKVQGLRITKAMLEQSTKVKENNDPKNLRARKPKFDPALPKSQGMF